MFIVWLSRSRFVMTSLQLHCAAFRTSYDKPNERGGADGLLLGLERIVAWGLENGVRPVFLAMKDGVVEGGICSGLSEQNI